jgi:hypothetical protein
MPRVSCPACNRVLNVPDAAVGKSGSCPACKHRFTVPAGPERAPEPALTAVEEPVAEAPAGATPPEPPKPRKKKRKKGGTPAAWLSRRWLMVAAAVVGAGLLAGVWLLRGGAGETSPAREPKASLQVGNPSTVYPHEFPPADPASWKMAAEATDTPPAGLRSAVPGPELTVGTRVLALAFSDPAAATAAIVLGARNRKGVPWWQASLTEPGAAKVVFLTEPEENHGLPSEPGEVALSPSGDLLATAFHNGYVGKPAGVTIWGRDGRKRSEWVEGQKVLEKRTVTGLWFASADRLLVLADDNLVCREVSTGRQVFKRPLKLVGDAVLTPRRTWLLAGVKDGVEAIATADGSTAGRLTIPEFRPDRGHGGGIRLAVSPDGARLAALPCCETGVPVVVWNLADGKAVFARYRDAESKWQGARPAVVPPLHWAGDRHLAMGGNAVFDLDLGGMTFTFGETVNAAPAAGATPDGRMWRLITVPNEKGGRFPAGGNYLTATAVPPLPDGGAVLGPHTSFRVDAEGASGSTAVVRETLADALADRGYRVDPAADLTVHFQGVKLTKVRVGGREVLNPKWDQRPPPGYKLVELVDGYEVTYQVRIRDRQGRLLWQSDNRGCHVVDFEEKGRVLGWTVAARQAAGHVPGGLVRLVPDAPPLNLPLKAAGRANGTAEVVAGP